MDSRGNKAHVVCIPAPIQGHVKPMLILAKLLFHKGFYITFVNTNSTHQSLLRSCGPDSLDGLPDFRFELISDHFPPEAADEPGPIRTQRLSAPFRDLVAKLNDATTSNAPPVSCILSDGFIFFTLDVAQELGVPIAFLFPISACSFLGVTHFETLRDKGFTPLRDESYLENGYLDTVIDWIPSMKDIRLRDFPETIRTTNPNDVMLRLAIEGIEKARKASAIVVNTFNQMEHDVLDDLSSMFPRVHAIGPLHLLLNKLPEHPSKSIGHSLWKEDTECLQWLDSKPPKSVLYVNFGSMVVLTPNQVIELGWGLSNSGYPFLFIIRPNLVIGGEIALPPELVVETKTRGMVTSWCPQEQVLEHPSVGGFLTHCGWNSTIESISAGVPMLCCPFFADQMMNCRFVCKEWGIGMEIDNDVKRGRVTELARELMERDKSKEMKRKAMEWKRNANEAVIENGSSSLALQKLVQDLLMSKEHILPKNN